MKKVEVTWIDASREVKTWVARSSGCRAETIRSVGYVHEETKKELVLVCDYTPHQVARMHAIPKACIKKIRKLK